MKAKKNIGSLNVVIVLAIVYLVQIIVPNKFNKPERVIAYDVISYYSYLPALFIEKDIKLSFWKNEDPYKKRYWPITTSDGDFMIKTTCGLSIMYSPFFAVAHLLAEPLGYEPNGFTLPYTFALLFSGVFFVILGMMVLRKFLLRHFSDMVTLITLAIIGLCSPLYWYATLESAMSHSYSFFLFSVFLYLTELWYVEQKWKYVFAVGVVAGMISLVRPSNLLVVLVFLLYGITSFKHVRERLLMFLHDYKKYLVMVILVIMVWIPQFIYWKVVTGHIVYYSYSDEGFYWLDPKIIECLFGFRKGLFLYSPILLCILPGIWFLRKKCSQYFIPIIIFSILNLYVISSWWCWWYGGGYSMRPMVESLALMAIPLAAFFEWFFGRKKVLKIAVAPVLCLMIFFSSFHIIQYYHEVIHYDSMSSKAYFNSFLNLNRSDEYWNLLDCPDYDEARKGNR